MLLTEVFRAVESGLHCFVIPSGTSTPALCSISQLLIFCLQSHTELQLPFHTAGWSFPLFLLPISNISTGVCCISVWIFSILQSLHYWTTVLIFNGLSQLMDFNNMEGMGGPLMEDYVMGGHLKMLRAF